MNLEQTKKLLKYYLETLTKKGYSPKKSNKLDNNSKDISEKELFDHICWLCSEAQSFNSKNDIDKISRWLGFIQGVLWKTNVYTIDEMREQVIKHSKKTA